MTTDELVDEIFGRCRERIERGERVDVEDVLRAHPDLADALRERFAAARMLDRDGARRRRSDPAALTRGGTALGRYRIETVLGAGGMGTVYLAHAERASDAVAAGARVALKVFHPHLVTRERFTERFRREADLGRRVDHPNVVRTLEADETIEADRPVRFLVMEHVEGRTLRDLLAEMGRLPEELCRHIGREVAKGLAAIHAAGAIHRDLKPDNVIVTKDHVVKVMDLGIARVDDAATLSETGVFVGSLLYGAPEQFGFRRAAGTEEAIPRSPARAKGDSVVDPRADLHALGLLLYELATGTHPFAGDDFHEVVRQILDLRPRRCGEIAPQLSPFFEELVAQLLEKDRARRPESAGEVASILEDGEQSSWWKERATAMRRETRRPLRRIRIPRETALYGRDTEISRLRALYEKAKAGDGQVVLVEGEAGIGKSRLVDEFVLSLWAAGEDIDFLFGSYPPGGAATASGAFATAYREHLGDDESAIVEALPQTPLLVPAFAALLRGDVAPADAEKLNKDSIQTCFVHVTRSSAARRTTIVFIDDLHFAPEEGRALFASIALAAPGHRILLVGGARRSLDETWSAGLARLPHVSRQPVERLSPKDLVDLLADTLRSRHLAEELGGKIAAKSDGNPFVVFEILRGLREGQFLTRRPDGTWITTRSIREIEVPPSILEVIQARVSGLNKDERDVLEVAACVGFEFDAGLVGAVLRVEPIPLLQRLGRIEKAHRLVRSTGHRFAFDHHQVQEVLYAGLSVPLREAYHAAIGDALEVRSGAAAKEPKDLEGALCLDLAEHFLAGAHAARALRYLARAFTHLETGWQNEAVIRLAERALAVPGLLEGAARVATLLRLTDRLDLLGRRDRQLAATEEALAIARTAGDRPGELRATSFLARWFWAHVRYEQAFEFGGRHLALACELGDRRAEGMALGNLSAGLSALGRFAEAQAHAERSLAVAREIGDRAVEAHATVNLGMASLGRGLHAESRRHFERSLAMARETGDRRSELVCLLTLGGSLISLGLFDDARELFERSVALARECGDRASEVYGAAHLGILARALGCLSRALDIHERQLALAREIGDRQSEVDATGGLGIVCYLLGRSEESRELVERYLIGAREVGARTQESHALTIAAESAAESGAVELAESRFADALSRQRALGARGEEAEALCARGLFLARLGRSDAARADLGAALALARESSPRIELGALAVLSTLPGGDVDAALTALAAHGERIETRPLAEARFLLWQSTHDRAHLDEAKRLLDFMVEHAPPECRESMVANVRLHREIAEAWREETTRGVAPPAA